MPIYFDNREILAINFYCAKQWLYSWLQLAYIFINAKVPMLKGIGRTNRSTSDRILTMELDINLRTDHEYEI